jgi:hypothetical protein
MEGLDGDEQRRRRCGGAWWQRWRYALEKARGRERAGPGAALRQG